MASNAHLNMVLNSNKFDTFVPHSRVSFDSRDVHSSRESPLPSQDASGVVCINGGFCIIDVFRRLTPSDGSLACVR